MIVLACRHLLFFFPSGTVWNYSPGTQSVLIPVDFSGFNPGTYQSVDSGFSTPLTVTLTVAPVPEPSSLALALCVVIGTALLSSTKMARTLQPTQFACPEVGLLDH